MNLNICIAKLLINLIVIVINAKWYFVLKKVDKQSTEKSSTENIYKTFISISAKSFK